MRKICFLTIAFVGLSFFANAQISKGSTFLGGSVGFNNRTSEQSNPQFPNSLQESKQNSFSIMPQLGIAVKENQIVGLSLNYSQSRNELGNGTTASKTKSSFSGGGVFYRRYFPIAQRFFLFGNADLGVGFGKGETTTPMATGTTTYVSAKSKSQQVSLLLTPGLSFAATRKLFVETSFNGLLGLTYNSLDADNFNQQGNVTQTLKEKTFSAAADANGFNNFFALGVRWILPSKR